MSGRSASRSLVTRPTEPVDLAETDAVDGLFDRADAHAAAAAIHHAVADADDARGRAASRLIMLAT